MGNRLIIFLFCLLTYQAWPQLVFDKIPVERQMIPRSKDNLGHFTVSGRSLSHDISAIRISITANDQPPYIHNQLIPFDDQFRFSVSLSIPATLADYDLEIFSIGTNGVTVLSKSVKDLVAGDYFIVDGQSNAAGSLGDDSLGLLTSSLYANKYCRSIGGLFERAVAVDPVTKKTYLSLEEDCMYFPANSIYYSAGCIGLWPLRMMADLVQRTGIPLCIVNGAIGSTELSYHMASHTPSDPNNLQLLENAVLKKKVLPYDRIFKKLYTNDVIAGVKGIFWYQGESDAVLPKDSAMNYNKRFARLRQSWKTDYPNLEKIFVFQVNTGCAGENLALIRDQQRRFSEKFDDVIVMPSVGSGQSERATDGCHYTLEGYTNLGKIMAPAVLKYLYGFELNDSEILPPRITRARYITGRIIALEFDKEITVQQSQHFTYQNEGTAYIKDYFYGEDKKKLDVRQVVGDGKNVYLYLESSKVKTEVLTYLPDIFSDVPTTYMGPWIVNKNNPRLGALSFYEIPVEPYREMKEKTVPSHEVDSVEIFPNPVTDRLNITTNTQTIKTIRLLDVNGTEVLKILPLGENESVSVDITALQNGIYFLSVELGEGNMTYKKITVSKN